MRIAKSIPIILVVFITLTVSVQAASLALRIQDVTGRPGASVQVPLVATGVSNLGSLHAEVTYDSSVLQATNVTAGGLAGGALMDFNLQQPGRAVIGLASAGGVTGTGDLVSITFDVLGEAGDATPLTLENVQATDTTFNPIQVNVASGRLQVGGGFGVLGFLLLTAVFAGLGIGGYVFTQRTRTGRKVTPTPRPSPQARLRVLSGLAYPAAVDLDRGPVYIGRAENSDLVVHDNQASRRHAMVERTPDGYTIRDLNSANGTRVNGFPITYIALQSGDRIQIGAAELMFTMVTEAGPRRR